MKITVEIQHKISGEECEIVYISFDRAGLKFLQECLLNERYMRAGNNVELFSSEWGGDELSTVEYHSGTSQVHKLEFQLRVDVDD